MKATSWSELPITEHHLPSLSVAQITASKLRFRASTSQSPITFRIQILSFNLSLCFCSFTTFCFNSAVLTEWYRGVLHKESKLISANLLLDISCRWRWNAKGCKLHSNFKFHIHENEAFLLNDSLSKCVCNEQNSLNVQNSVNFPIKLGRFSFPKVPLAVELKIHQN